MTTFTVYRKEKDDVNPPVAIATGLTTKSYVDDTAQSGKTYLYSVAAIRDSIEKVSNEIEVSTITSDDPYVDYVHLYMPLVSNYDVVVGDAVITQNGANNSFAASGGINNEGYYIAGAASYFEFEMPNFFGTEPFCIEYYAKTSTGISTSVGIASFGATKNVDFAILTHTSAGAYVSRNNTSWLILGGTPTVDPSLSHYAFTWDGTTFRRFKNGTIASENAFASPITQTKNLATIGKKSNSLGFASDTGMQHLRITKGVPRYTENFVPPTNFVY